MSQYKLYYFNAKGVTEPIRLLFAYARVSYEDIRFSRGPQWTALKPNMPWNVVPVLEVDGEKLSQSRAILRFLAKRFGLYPENPMDAAKCDEYIEAIIDLRTEGKKFHRESDPDKKLSLKDQFVADNFLKFMKKLKEILEGGNNGYLVGGKLSYADVFIAYTVEQINSWLDLENPLVNYPEVQRHHDMVMSLPGIKEWVETRPKTPS